jgi:hypothetical protein
MAITGVDYVIIKGFTTSTAGTPATTIDNSGKITVANNQLPKLGIVSITPNGGVTAV